jgi:predicted N-acetyltransferase YhbS
MNIAIRNETESDIKAISDITKAAFDALAISITCLCFDRIEFRRECT